ncbi:ankycorbin-like [Argopecten irradians]|uniref:ankycorbin-like n=1 Tax=Argopecten irradians TaxID=31199 RepID=UPI0037191E30
MTTPPNVKAVRFNEEVKETELTGRWSFLRYLLTLNDELNLQIVADTLEDRGALIPSQKEAILQQTSDRERTEKCLELVRKSGPKSYTLLCEVLKDCGYSNLVESLKAEHGEDSEYNEESEQLLLNIKDLEISNITFTPDIGTTPSGDLSVVGMKMSLTDLAKDTKASQKDIAIVMQKQSDLEQHLQEVMKSLDTAKEALAREREEKLQLQEQLSARTDDLEDMQRKYRELQKAMGKLKETNNKYHEKVTKLQIDNEELRKSTKDKGNLQIELESKKEEITSLKKQIEEQKLQITDQQSLISDRLGVIDSLATEHQKLSDGQSKLESLINRQSEQITTLLTEKEESQVHLSNQQQQLNFQHNSILMLQESMEKLQQQLETQAEQNVIGIYPSEQHHRPRRGAPTKQPVYYRPFNSTGKPENSKNAFWKHPQDSNRSRHK